MRLSGLLPTVCLGLALTLVACGGSAPAPQAAPTPAAASSAPQAVEPTPAPPASAASAQPAAQPAPSQPAPSGASQPTPAVPPAPAAPSPAPAAPAPTGPQPQPALTKTAQVVMENIAYHPGSLTVAVGTTVVWTNKDTVDHTVNSAPDAPVSFQSGNLEPGMSFRFTFTKPGTYS